MADKELSIVLKTKDKSSEEFKKIDKRARELSRGMRDYGVEGGEALDAVQREFRELREEADRLGVQGTRNMSKLKTQINKLGGSTDKAEGKMDRLRRATGKVNGALGKLDLPGWLGPAALAGLGADMIKTAGDFETAMMNVSTLMDGNVGPQVNKLKKGIIALSKEFPKKPTELGAEIYPILSAGITDADKAIETLRESTRLSISGLGNMKESTDLMTSAINAFKKEELSTSEISNVLFETVKAGKTDVSQLSGNFGKAAANAAAAGIKFADMQAMTAALTTSGLNTEKSQTYLAQAFLETTKAGTRFQGALKDANISGKQWKEMVGEKGLGASLEYLRDKLGISNTKLKNLFGSAEAGTAVFALLDSVSDKYSDTLSRLRDDTADIDSAVERNTGGMNNSVTSLQAAYERLSIQLGDTGALDTFVSVMENAVIPAIDGASDLFRDTAYLLEEFVDSKYGDKIAMGIYKINNRMEVMQNQVGEFLWEKYLDFRGLEVTSDDILNLLRTMAEEGPDIIASMIDEMVEVIITGGPRLVEAAGNAVDKIIDHFKRGKDEVVTNSIVPDMIDEIGIEFQRLNEEMTSPVRQAVDDTNREFERLKQPTVMARPTRPGQEPKSKEDRAYEAKMTKYKGQQDAARATESLNRLMQKVHMDSLSGHEKEVAREKQLYQQQLEQYREYYSQLNEEQQKQVDKLAWREEIEQAHNQRMMQIERDKQQALIEEKKRGMKATELLMVQQGKVEEAVTVKTGRKLLGQLAETNKTAFEANKAFSIADAIINAFRGISKTMSEYPFPVNVAFAAAHAAIAWKQVESIKNQSFEGGGGSGGRISGGGAPRPSAKRDRGGGDVPNRNTQPAPERGKSHITIDTGRLRGKMLMGDAADITNWTLDQLNEKHKANAVIEFA